MTEFESDIECAHCGERFYYELTHCPNCGRSVYPNEEASDPEPPLGAGASAGARTFLAAGVGMLITGAVGIVAYMFLRGVTGDGATGFSRIIQLASVPLGAVAGGYAAAATEKANPRAAGIGSGLASIFIVILITSFEKNLATESLITLEFVIWWAAIVLGGFYGADIWRKQNEQTVLQQLFGGLPEEDALYEDLLVKSGHDKARVERLIGYEKRFMPNANRRTLIEAAITRWQKDNR